MFAVRTKYATQAVTFLLRHVTVMVMLFLGCSRVSPPSVCYAPYGDDDYSRMDFVGPEDHASKVDFAQLEHDCPLSRADRDEMTFNPNNLKAGTQEQVDQIYARLTAGSLPQGDFRIEVWFPKGRSGNTRISEIAGGGMRGLPAKLLPAKLEFFGNNVWKGKVFDQKNGVVRTMLPASAILPAGLKLAGLTELATSIAEIPPSSVNGRRARVSFPAKVYCGQSLLDGRRESIIIDYAFSGEIDGYRKEVDWLTGPQGLQLRDEIRMVRPGFYLGRAYMGRVFVLNFILYREETVGKAAERFDEDCWVGSQRIAALRQ